MSEVPHVRWLLMREVPLYRLPRIEVLEGETAMHLAARSVSESALCTSPIRNCPSPRDHRRALGIVLL